MSSKETRCQGDGSLDNSVGVALGYTNISTIIEGIRTALDIITQEK